MFAGLVFAISSDNQLEVGSIRAHVQRHGGTISSMVHRKVFALVCSTSALQRNTQRVRKARRHGVPIVSEDFVSSCVRQLELLDTARFPVEAGAAGGAGVSPLSPSEALACARQLAHTSVSFRDDVHNALVAKTAGGEAGLLSVEPSDLEGRKRWHRQLGTEQSLLRQYYAREYVQRSNMTADGEDPQMWLAAHEQRLQVARRQREERQKARAGNKARNKPGTRTAAIVSTLNENGVSTWSNAKDDCYCVCHEDGDRRCCWYCGGTREFVWKAPDATQSSAATDTDDLIATSPSLSIKGGHETGTGTGTETGAETEKQKETDAKEERKGAVTVTVTLTEKDEEARTKKAKENTEKEKGNNKEKGKHEKDGEGEKGKRRKKQKKKRSRKRERERSPSPTRARRRQHHHHVDGS